MGILRFKVEEVKRVIFGSSFVNFVRNTTEIKNVNVTYSGGTGQTLSASQVLYTYLTPSDVGYIKIEASSNNTLNGSGVLDLKVNHRSSSSQGNQNVAFDLFGSQVVLQFNYNSKPIAEDIVIDIPNRATYIFKASDFIDHFQDDDFDALDSVSIHGNVDGYSINGAPYIEGEYISISAIDAGLLIYTALSQDVYYETNNTWKAKDVNGNESE